MIDTMTNNNATMMPISDVHNNIETQPATQSHLASSEYTEVYAGGGILEIMEDGFGILRGEQTLPNSRDVYISASQIRRFSLRAGDYVTGQIRPPKDREQYAGLLRVESVNGQDPETARNRPHFDSLTPIFPTKPFNLETTQNNLSGRLVNLVRSLRHLKPVKLCC